MEKLVQKYFNEARINVLIQKLNTSDSIEILSYKKVGSRNSEIHELSDKLIERFNLILKEQGQRLFVRNNIPFSVR
jgi:hypothetical protein